MFKSPIKKHSKFSMFTSEGIQVASVDVVNKNGKFTDDINFDISFRCFKPLNEIVFDVIWHSPKTRENQVLLEATVGPIQVGVNRLVLPAPAPNCPEILDSECEVTLRAKYQDECFYSTAFHARNESPEDFGVEKQDFSMIARIMSESSQGATVCDIRW